MGVCENKLRTQFLVFWTAFINRRKPRRVFSTVWTPFYANRIFRLKNFKNSNSLRAKNGRRVFRICGKKSKKNTPTFMNTIHKMKKTLAAFSNPIINCMSSIVYYCAFSWWSVFSIVCENNLKTIFLFLWTAFLKWRKYRPYLLNLRGF